MNLAFFLIALCLSLNVNAARTYKADISFKVNCVHVNPQGSKSEFSDVYGIKFSPDVGTIQLLGSEGYSSIVAGVPFDKEKRTARYHYEQEQGKYLLDVLIRISADNKVLLKYYTVDYRIRKVGDHAVRTYCQSQF